MTAPWRISNPASSKYGRPDQNYTRTQQEGNRDIYRDERDGLDRDTKKGVDCSALVWRALKNAGFNIEEKFPRQISFTTASLFQGRQLTAYAREHFDVLPPSSKTDGSLKPGDLLMMKMPSGSQHIVIFKEYDDQGRIRFFGSQSSTGPAEVILTGNRYWDQQTQFFGALRAKESFIKPEHRIQAEDLNNTHPDNAVAAVPPQLQTLYRQCENHVHAHCREHGIEPGQGMRNTVAALTVAAYEKKMPEINLFAVKGSDVYAGYRDHLGTIDYVALNGKDIAHTPEQESFARISPAREQHERQQELAQVQRSTPL